MLLSKDDSWFTSLFAFLIGVGMSHVSHVRAETKPSQRSKPTDKLVASLEALGVRVYGLDASLLNSSNGDTSWDIAGYEQQKREIEDTILLALRSPKVYDDISRGTRRKFESNRPRAILFEGPPGTGKTSCARVIANQAGIPLLHLPVEVVLSRWYGKGERLLGEVFSIANELPNGAIIFLDEVDSLASARHDRMHETTRRLLSVLLRQIDGFEQDKKVVVIGATNRKEDLDPAFISRFDTIIYFGLPDQQTREEIAAQYTKHLTKSESVELANITEGMSGRNIRDLCQQAERQWASKIIRGKTFEDGERGSLPPLQEYIESTASRKNSDKSIANLESMGVRVYGLDSPLSNSSNSDISWDNIAGYEQQKREIEDTILLAFRSPKVYDDIASVTRRKFESNKPRAVLFEGPPGTGKTSCARVIANQAGIPLLHLPLEVILSKWYGEGERLLGKVFSIANELPNGAIIFLDEVDSFAGARDGQMHEVTRRLLSVLLRQIDGFEQDKKVVVIGATNQKEDLDPAFISRFDTMIYFGLPDQQTREEIAAQYTKHLTKPESVEFAKTTEGMSGRDIRDLCQQAERQWASKIIRGKAPKDGERGSLPPLQEYIESAASRKKAIQSIKEKNRRSP